MARYDYDPVDRPSKRSRHDGHSGSSRDSYRDGVSSNGASRGSAGGRGDRDREHRHYEYSRRDRSPTHRRRSRSRSRSPPVRSRDYSDRSRNAGHDRRRDEHSRRDRERDQDAKPRRRWDEQPRQSPSAASATTAPVPTRPLPTGIASLPSRPSFLPNPPAPEVPDSASPAVSVGGTDSPAHSNGNGETDKVRARRERLEAWRREQEAKKAMEEAKARAQSVVAAHIPTATALPAHSSDGPTTINMTGLRGRVNKTADAIKSKGSTGHALDDVGDQPAKKLFKKLNLPPMDPLLKPGAGGKVGSGSDLEGDDGEDEDEDEEQSTAVPMQVDEKAEGEAKDDEEEDPLDAFMKTVQQEYKSVNEADRRRTGGGVVAPVIGQDDDEPRQSDDKEPDKLDAAGAEDILALAAKKIKKKEMPTVDHATIDYEPFRKRFYHEPLEVSEMTEDEASELRMELDDITVRGKDCPKPLTKWSYCGLPAACLDVIKKLEYHSPTSIQAQTIPAIMSGRDMIGVAKTGSGKTMAFLLPMFRHIKDQRPVEKNEGPIGLIMTPTRELAVQIYRESKPFLKATGLRAVCAYGGAPISEQIAEMKKTADIVVATPGRMIDLLTANQGRVTNLRRVTYLVLDEADRMFDMGFEPQVMKIINNVRPDRQTVLFSATFPKQMESLARKVLRNKPLEVTVGSRSVVAPEIEQIVEVRSEDSKFNRLLEILGQTYNQEKDQRTLVFVDRQEAADELFRQLLGKGYATMSLHGGQEQVDRDATINDFKAGKVDVVVATSVAARGLDVKQLKLVVNYDAPNHMEDYVHRAGRTGRAGNKGTCVTFITSEQERYAKDIIAALKASKVHVPAELQSLADSFREKVAAGKAQAASSGFGGKGLERLENDREKALKAQRSAYGEGDDTNAEDKGGKTALDDVKIQKGGAPPNAAHEQLSGVADFHVEVKKGAAPQSVRENKVRADEGTSAGASDAADQKVPGAKISGADPTKLAQALAAINSRRNALKTQKGGPSSQDKDRDRKPKDPDATDFHAIVPINDFPQKARWRCTNKETMSSLISETGASITNRGVFYEKGKEPEPGQPPKLQLLIESNDEEKVEGAVRAIKQILLEATQQALEAEQRNSNQGPGRYNVV